MGQALAQLKCLVMEAGQALMQLESLVAFGDADGLVATVTLNAAGSIEPVRECVRVMHAGGAEHAVLHLLYARFWHKVLFDLGVVSQPEPFQRLVSQGMILGEVSARWPQALSRTCLPWQLQQLSVAPEQRAASTQCPCPCSDLLVPALPCSPTLWTSGCALC